MIIDHFSQLKKSIDLASDRQIERLNRCRNELLKEIEKFENKCFNAFDAIKTSKQNIFKESQDLIERNELISREW